ncbi:MAG: hypothetical protein M9962_14155 [Oligoflexia bacterium]|nr:hypothetical protein [Oligoflexia bacterium]
MFNFLRQIAHSLFAQQSLLILFVFLASASITEVQAKSPKYKSRTVVDFEGALVEGKSRKPYSTYLTQQKDAAFSDLHNWEPDIDKNASDRLDTLEQKL